ncbi:hypothetical protein QG37_02384 [Candidozyma auris]|uniref:Uncharacterized protein n=1 Tax=Candidozyma auris TaxID=498019 RepID=A0A0L0P259_CANAR|nr:hypothetical protein QG37_02384 [[Candida] auris]
MAHVKQKRNVHGARQCAQARLHGSVHRRVREPKGDEYRDTRRERYWGIFFFFGEGGEMTLIKFA